MALLTQLDARLILFLVVATDPCKTTMRCPHFYIT